MLGYSGRAAVGSHQLPASGQSTGKRRAQRQGRGARWRRASDRRGLSERGTRTTLLGTQVFGEGTRGRRGQNQNRPAAPERQGALGRRGARGSEGSRQQDGAQFGAICKWTPDQESRTPFLALGYQDPETSGSRMGSLGGKGSDRAGSKKRSTFGEERSGSESVLRARGSGGSGVRDTTEGSWRKGKGVPGSSRPRLGLGLGRLPAAPQSAQCALPVPAACRSSSSRFLLRSRSPMPGPRPAAAHGPAQRRRWSGTRRRPQPPRPGQAPARPPRPRASAPPPRPSGIGVEGRGRSWTGEARSCHLLATRLASPAVSFPGPGHLIGYQGPWEATPNLTLGTRVTGIVPP